MAMPQTQQPDKLGFALQYAALGWPVFPLHAIGPAGCSCGKPCKSPGKHPLTLSGLKEAACDEVTIRRWWKRWPHANIGLVTGAASGLFVLDIDPKSNGDETLDRLRAQYGKIPDDVMAITGSGGQHFFFQYPGAAGRSTTGLYPGIDTRGDGGYVVAAPSNHLSGREYFWDGESNPLEGATVPPTPNWLLLRLSEKKPAALPSSPAALLPADEVKRIRGAFPYIPADDRDIWLAVGMALHSSGAGDQGFGLWCEWAQQSSRFDLADQRRVWDSFKPAGNKGVSLASLFSLAKQNGWIPIAASRPPEPPPLGELTPPAAVPAVSRKTFEAELDAAGDDLDQVLRIADSLQRSALHAAEIEILLKRAAKAVGVSAYSLRTARKSAPPDGESPSAGSEGYVEELNDKHAIVPVGGRVLVMNQEYDPALERKMITFSSAGDFQLRYSNQKTWQHGDRVDVATAWLDHPNRRQYDGVVFAPHKTVPDYFNLFQGFGIAPKPGSCERFKQFVREVICSDDDELFDYLWQWLAHLFQLPGELPGTAFVLRGKQGVGKNTFVDVIGALVGSAHFIQLSNIQQVTGRFSGHLADVLLVFANEAIWGGDKTAEGALKHMVTDPITAIERKGRDIIAMNNYKRLIAASNEDWVIPRGLDDRRFIIVDVSDAFKENHSYFARIKKELAGGGYAALMYELLATDLAYFDPRAVPDRLKQTGWELKIRSGGSIVQWWHSVLENGYLWEAEGYAEEAQQIWPTDSKKADVHALYLGWCKKHNVLHPEIDCVFGRKLKEFGLQSRQLSKYNQKRCYLFPPLRECRGLFSQLCAIPLGEWEDIAT